MDGPSQERSAHGEQGWLETLERELDRRERVRERALDAEIHRLHALRDADLRLLAERDRRYVEVQAEREKRQAVKEQADQSALRLARQIQDYKDEKANELRAQIESERGSYVSRMEFEDKVSTAFGRVDELRDMLAALRTEVAVGPGELPRLRSRLDLSEGEHAGRTGYRALIGAAASRWIAFAALIVSIALVLVAYHH